MGASNSKPVMSRLPIPITAALALAAAGAAAQPSASPAAVLPSASPAAALVDFLILDEDGKPVEEWSRPIFFAGQFPAGRVFP